MILVIQPAILCGEMPQLSNRIVCNVAKRLNMDGIGQLRRVLTWKSSESSVRIVCNIASILKEDSVGRPIHILI